MLTRARLKKFNFPLDICLIIRYVTGYNKLFMNCGSVRPGR